MTPDSALAELLGRVAATWGSRTLLTVQELDTWPPEAVTALRQQKLLRRAQPARSTVCPGCERECAMPVHTVTGRNGDTASFVVCDKRDDINRVAVSAKHLKQWKCCEDFIAEFIAEALSLTFSGQRIETGQLLQIGMLSGRKRAQMLCLGSDPQLVVVAGTNTVPVVDLLSFQGGIYVLDGEHLREMVDAAAGDSRHTPSTARREARKLDTAAMYEDWRREYRALKRRKPGRSDVWYSQQIARMDISQGRSADTIRKHMKP